MLHLNLVSVNYVRSPKMLWQGAYYMNGSQTITLSEPVSAQPHGIVIHWQKYEDGQAKGQNHTYFFVQKTHVTNWPGDGCDFSSVSANTAFWKYLYIDDTTIKGNTINEKSNYVVAGVTHNNNGFVLTEVIGV